MQYFFLIGQIVFSSVFTIVIKWTQTRDRGDIVTIGAINYVIAAIAIVPEYLPSEPTAMASTAAWLGGTMGAVYFVAFFFVIYAIKHVGASATTVVSVLSMIVPISFGAYFWNEMPNGRQVAGVALAFVALSMIGGARSGPAVERKAWMIPVILILFFSFCGISRLTQEALKHMGDPADRPTFLMAAFAVASVPSLMIIVSRSKRITKLEWAMGLCLGLANILQSHFILKALQYLPGYFVFPVTSAGGVALTTLVATNLLGEKLTTRTQIGIGIAIVALFLLPGGA
ncbi:DMT family transporter [bacterium]|nr:DMT family transporter [bacterium]